jgi:hypothetical protein
MVAAQEPAIRDRDEPGIQIARDCDVVQPPAAAPDPDRVCAAMASSSSAYFESAVIWGAVTWANPGTKNAPVVAERLRQFVNHIG